MLEHLRLLVRIIICTELCFLVRGRASGFRGRLHSMPRLTAKPRYSCSLTRAHPAYVHTAKTMIFYPTNISSFINNSTMELDIEKALADLGTQVKPNYSATAAKHYVGRTTLMRRHLHKTRSRVAFLSKTIQSLTKDQEETLIFYINRITDRGQPPTS